MGESSFLATWGWFTAYAMVQLALPALLRGRIRAWAFLPVPIMLLVLGISLSAQNLQSNLWPIWLFLVSPLATAYLVGLGGFAMLRKVRSSSGQRRAP
jgi:hypothetical protein